jgi:GTP-binding protein
MLIESAQFVVSNTDHAKCPAPDKPEFAFIGRSNVGKSSLINMITGQKDLAMTSSKPGKTQLINHFIINNNWYLVDLPGYGFAKVSKKQRAKFDKMITAYISLRKNLVCTFVLLDSRLPLQNLDKEFIEWLGMNELPFALVLTKYDKLSQSELSKNLNNIKKELLEDWAELPTIFVTSAEKKRGSEELLKFIGENKQYFSLHK